MKIREEKWENELNQKEQQIRQLSQVQQPKQSDTSQTQFLMDQIVNLQNDVQRHHAKYVDMRQFAYLQIEALVKQIN